MFALQQAVVVCEREPYWTPELQRQFLGSDVAVRGCRKWGELAPLSRPYARAVEVVDLDASPAEILAGLARRSAEPVPCPLVVLARPRFAELEWVLREAGVQAFYADLVPGDELARCCRRWLEP
jgi:hypothetical protein